MHVGDLSQSADRQNPTICLLVNVRSSGSCRTETGETQRWLGQRTDNGRRRVVLSGCGEMRHGLLLFGIALAFLLLLGAASGSADPEPQAVVKGPTFTPTDTATATPTSTDTPTPTDTPTTMPTSTPTYTATPIHTATLVPTVTGTPTAAVTDTATPSATVRPLEAVGAVGVTTGAPTATAVASATPEPAPPQAPIESPSAPPFWDPGLAGVSTLPSAGDSGLLGNSGRPWTVPVLMSIGGLIFAVGGLALRRARHRR